MRRELIRQLDEAIAEVFAQMLNLTCVPDHQSAVPAANPDACLTASVEFRGEPEGICILQLTEATAADLTANLTGIPIAEIPPDLCADTAGELCNMIAGCWKTCHPPERATSHLSCPVVTRGAPAYPVGLIREAVTLIYRFNGQSLTLHLALR